MEIHYGHKLGDSKLQRHYFFPNKFPSNFCFFVELDKLIHKLLKNEEEGHAYQRIKTYY